MGCSLCTDRPAPTARDERTDPAADGECPTLPASLFRSACLLSAEGVLVPPGGPDACMRPNFPHRLERPRDRTRLRARAATSWHPYECIEPVQLYDFGGCLQWCMYNSTAKMTGCDRQMTHHINQRARTVRLIIAKKLK